MTFSLLKKRWGRNARKKNIHKRYGMSVEQKMSDIIFAN